VGAAFDATATRPCVGAAFGAGFGAFIGFFAALLGAAGFFAAGRFFMPRTVQRAHASVNAPAGAAARR
jgi:hypothetical protein